MNQNKIEGFPDPRDRSRNQPSILLTPEEAMKVYLLGNGEPPRIFQQWTRWWQDNLYKHGWNNVIFSGHQIVLTALSDLRSNQIVSKADDSTLFDETF